VTPPLRSARLEVADALEANEIYQRNGWTDGLPIVPPTEARVRECLESTGMAPDEVLGVEPVRRLVVTAEKVAVNAIMAGCLLAYFPVVAAAIQAMCEDPFLLRGATASTAHGGGVRPAGLSVRRRPPSDQQRHRRRAPGEGRRRRPSVRRHPA
jgi:hypothetical protein